MENESYMELSFQWYNNGIKNIRPNGFITLRQLINTIIAPKPEMIEAFKLIQDAGKRGDKETKDRLKGERLFFTTPSAVFNPIRNYESIEKYLPLAIFEYDDIPHAEELRDYIFERRKDCIFAFNSPSATGTKFIFLIETPKSISHYKELWFGIAHDLDKFINLDQSNSRLTQPLYNSYDPNAKFREDAVAYSARGYKTTAFTPFVAEEIEIPTEIDEESQLRCLTLIGNLIDDIIDSAHNKVVSNCFLAGGITSYYSISQDEMWNLIETKIRENAYMSKGVDGYLKTATTMFNKGIQFPTALS